MPDGAITELTFLVRLFVAGLLAGILGWERQHAKKAAGFRTHIIVGTAAALFTAIGELSISHTHQPADGSHPDLTRVIQAVAVGIGFLGSGIIVVGGTGSNRNIRGLTTAASIWATAAIGMAAALGYYLLAVGATLLLLFVLRMLERFEAEHEG